MAESLCAFTAGRLIALDKKPCVHPIGVSEVLRRTRHPKVAGTTQLCSAWQEGRCEAAVHAVQLVFEDDDCEAVLLVDASNAFTINALNKKTALHFARLCPSLSTTLRNVYKEDVTLFVDCESGICREGTTQGDPWQWCCAQ